jgi:hypothetical protein
LYVFVARAVIVWDAPVVREIDVLALVPLVVENDTHEPLSTLYSHLLQLTLADTERVTVDSPDCVTDAETVGAALSMAGADIAPLAESPL